MYSTKDLNSMCRAYKLLSDYSGPNVLRDRFDVDLFLIKLFLSTNYEVSSIKSRVIEIQGDSYYVNTENNL